MYNVLYIALSHLYFKVKHSITSVKSRLIVYDIMQLVWVALHFWHGLALVYVLSQCLIIEEILTWLIAMPILLKQLVIWWI